MSRRPDWTRRVACLAATMLLGAAATWAARPQRWTETPENLARGEADGVAVTQRGLLFPAPKLSRIGSERTPGEPSYVWSAVTDGAGNVYLGTGPEGHVVKVRPSGEQAIHFTVDDPLVSALAITADGDLLAGTAPGGLVYRIRPDGTGDVWSETGERYVWALVRGGDGAVYAGTGERGSILKLLPSGKSEVYFDSDEAHIVSLAAHPGGGLLAGGAGRGLVYEIDAEGHGHVLFEGDLPEVTALARDAEGQVLAAFIAPPAAPGEPPALRLRLPDGAQVGTTDENVGALAERSGPVLHGFIEGIPGAAPPDTPRLRGRLLRISPDGHAEELWSSRSETPFCLLRDDAGGLLFGTGEPARIYRVERDGDVALLATLHEAQVTELVTLGRAVVAATSNPAAAYRLDGQRVDGGTFVSRPFDAGAPARWGAIRWKLSTDAGGRTEIYTRTGNSREPDGTWSGWGPAFTDPRASRVDNPDGRYLQWRARFAGAQSETHRVSAVTVHYEPYNRPPQVRDFRLEATEGAVSGPARFRWSALDPDHDPVQIELRYRSAGGDEWRGAVLEPVGETSSAGSATWREERGSWDTDELAEGPYELRAEASDRAANDAASARTIVVERGLAVVVDRSPPEIVVSPLGAGRLGVTVTDRHSAVQRLELLEGGRVSTRIAPRDGVCDSRQELFELDAAASGVERALRAYDAAGHVADHPLP